MRGGKSIGEGETVERPWIDSLKKAVEESKAQREQLEAEVAELARKSGLYGYYLFLKLRAEMEKWSIDRAIVEKLMRMLIARVAKEKRSTKKERALYYIESLPKGTPITAKEIREVADFQSDGAARWALEEAERAGLVRKVGRGLWMRC